jgi:hypothetical protein
MTILPFQKPINNNCALNSIDTTLAATVACMETEVAALGLTITLQKG